MNYLIIALYLQLGIIIFQSFAGFYFTRLFNVWILLSSILGIMFFYLCTMCVPESFIGDAYRKALCCSKCRKFRSTASDSGLDILEQGIILIANPRVDCAHVI